MISVCFAAKGGSGTTVVTTATAVTTPGPALLVDLAGDVPGVLGLSDPDTPGVLDWLRSDAAASRLGQLEIAATSRLSVLAAGTPGGVPPERWHDLAVWLAGQPRDVLIDAGTAEPPAALIAVADRTVLVTRACYLALRAAVRRRCRPSEIVLVAEPGRALRARDIEAALGAPVVATVLVDPAVARAVDAGLLATRVPSAFRRVLRAAA